LELKQLGKTDAEVPVLGLGTWGMGGFSSRLTGGEGQAVQALRIGLELGMGFIDTAEMYASGHSEEIVAAAIKENRESVFVATKVSPEHLRYDDVLRSCEASLRRLKTNYIDLYQIHWPNSRIPIQQTMKAMEQLHAEGKIRHIGVSNFSVKQTKEAQEALSKAKVVSNQVEYSLLERSIERDLLPWARKERVTIIAYSPLARGQIPEGGRGNAWKTMDELAAKYAKTRAQIALNWLITQDPVVAIPKAVSADHVKENARASGWNLSKQDFESLSKAFT